MIDNQMKAVEGIGEIQKGEYLVFYIIRNDTAIILAAGRAQDRKKLKLEAVKAERTVK